MGQTSTASSLINSSVLVMAHKKTKTRNQPSLCTKTIGYMKLTSIFTYMNYVHDPLNPTAHDNVLRMIKTLSCQALEDIPTSVHLMNDFDIIKYAHNEARSKYGINLI